MNSDMSFSATYPFNLPLLPPAIDYKSSLFMEPLLKARAEIGELKGYTYAMPNPLLLMSPSILRESVASSNIENIITTVPDVLQQQLFPETEQRKPDKEVLHYRDAVMYGFEQLDKLPICTRMILGIYKKLLPADEKKYRSIQNKIVNDRTGEAIYTPPPANEIGRFITNWENFINNRADNIDPLIKCAIAHYQFEAIYPFKDGNGRVGRILIVLYLVQEKLLHLPILYISGHINKNRDDYYRLLRNVSCNNNWEEFITFMLEAFYVQAKVTKEMFFNTMSLLAHLKSKIKIEHNKIYSADLVELLFTYPVITPVKLGEQLNIHYTTASRYLKQLGKAGILKNLKVGKYHLYVNESLIKILNQ